MGHEFEQIDEAEVKATPEEVWLGIATGPGIDTWSMGRNEIDAGNSVVSTSFGGYEVARDVTAWSPPRHLAYRSPTAPDGRFTAYEFLVEARDGGSTVLRIASNAFIPGDDWEEEYEAMRAGSALFFATLVEYLSHFPGRTAVPLTVWGPEVADWPLAWARLGGAFGLDRAPATGDRVTCPLFGSGVVYLVNDQVVGVRTANGFYRFLRGFRGPLVMCHAEFSPGATEQNWLDYVGGVL